MVLLEGSAWPMLQHKEDQYGSPRNRGNTAAKKDICMHVRAEADLVNDDAVTAGRCLNNAPF